MSFVVEHIGPHAATRCVDCLTILRASQIHALSNAHANTDRLPACLCRICYEARGAIEAREARKA